MDTNALIGAWELALTRPVAARMAQVLDVVGHAAPTASLDLHEREREALRLHAAIAGDLFDAEATCAYCGERLEFGIPLAALDAAPDGAHRLDHEGWQIVLRVPRTDDVCRALEDSDSDAALFRACVASARHDGETRKAEEIPADVRTLCEARLDEIAPLANLAVACRCPACGAADSLPLDVGAYVFERLGHWVEDQLDEVARLCRAYAWDEGRVLAMSAWRRRFYLERAGTA